MLEQKAGETKKPSILYNHHTPFAGETNFNTTWQGTAAWMAPEAMGKNNYGFPADVYSFGIIMLHPFIGITSAT